MDSKEEYRMLMRIAKKDLNYAKHGLTMDEIFVEGVCHHCQQSSEKSLKAFLIFNNITYRFTHDLETLCSDCQEIDDTFSALNNHCYFLSRFSSGIRYADTFIITEEDMQKAIKLAEEVFNFVKEKTQCL